MSETRFVIERRKRIVVNTDPLKRCYNGCHFETRLLWGEWEALNYEVSSETLADKLNFWRELNDYAVSCRGEGARCEFRSVPHQWS